MKISFSIKIGIFSIVLISIVVLAGASPKRFELNKTIHHVFAKWMVEHDRNYSTMSEMIKRKKIFKKFFLYIKKSNSQGNNTYRLAINKFADMIEEDMPNCLLEDPKDFLAFDQKIVSFNISEENLPDSFDWREHDAVSPVRDQGITCGNNLDFLYIIFEW
ncbi:cathepsin L [Trifolium repens]|nr:cathepsin L [Trifolium repens]